MPAEVILPKVDMDMTTGTIAVWHVKDGDTVKKGQVWSDGTPIDAVDLLLVVIIALPLLVTGVVALGWRWAPILGAFVFGLLLLLLVVVEERGCAREA